MAKKKVIFLYDTEIDIHGNVLDFGGVIVDRLGNVQHSIGVLVDGYYNNPVDYPLFHLKGMDGIFSPERLQARYSNYNKMLDTGVRTLASVSAINRWLARVNATYQPILTAYNLAFDIDKCENTGIDVGQFKKSFCLMATAQKHFGNQRKYKKLILENHLFDNHTRHENMSYQTNADTMAIFLLGIDHPDKRLTAYVDCVGYELKILTSITKARSLKWCLDV